MPVSPPFYELFFSNNQLGNFNTANILGLIFNPTGNQTLRINSQHPGDRLVDAGAISSVSDITGWRLTVEGDQDPGDNDVITGSNVIVEYSTDGGATWNNYLSDSGLSITSLQVRQDEEGWMAITGNDPSQPDGQVGFIVADAGVTPGQNFITDETIFETQVNEYALPCFTRGTLIATHNGLRAIEDLSAGDRVLTMDNGYQEIAWIGARKLDAIDLRMNTKLLPIRIKMGALGKGLPEQDLMVSPQHRMLVRSLIAKRMFGENEVLISANKLLPLDGINIVEDAENVEYFHMLFDHHEIVFANGAPSESLFTGPEALKSLDPEALEEITALFPEILLEDYLPQSARYIPKRGKLMKKLALRHQANHKPLVDELR